MIILQLLVVDHQECHDPMLDMNKLNAKFSRLRLTGLPKFNPWSCKLDLMDTSVSSLTPLQNYLTIISPMPDMQETRGQQTMARYPLLHSLWAKNGFSTFK